MATTDGGEPGDMEMLNGEIGRSIEEEIQEEEEYNYIPRCRYAYTQEHKLAAINYFQMT
jgi:hypothetical protein